MENPTQHMSAGGCVLVALLPDPEQQGLLGRDPEAVVQRRASGRNRTAAGRAARQGGARVQTDQGLHGGLTGTERQTAGQLLDLQKPPKQFLFNVSGSVLMKYISVI